MRTERRKKAVQKRKESKKSCILDKETGDECSSNYDEKAEVGMVMEGESLEEVEEEEGKECRSNDSKKAMKRGFQEGMNPTRFNYAWRTWGFQVNFMYKPVL